MIGQLIFQQYKVIEQIAPGSFGNTYIVIDTAFPEQPRRLLKHLCPINTDPKFLQIAKRLFEREAECLYKLGEHDQIPRLYSYFEENNQFYLVQQLIEGQDLSHEFQRGERWSEEKTVKFLQELLQILSFVHQHNTIHRDIKPANIMRRQRNGKLILIDFGTVVFKAILTVGKHVTKCPDHPIIIHTPAHVPREQFMGRPGKYSDIYAVGMLGLQALSGLASKDLPLDELHLDELQQFWKRLNGEVSFQLKRVLERMVKYQFSERYQDADEALNALVPVF